MEWNNINTSDNTVQESQNTTSTPQEIFNTLSEDDAHIIYTNNDLSEEAENVLMENPPYKGKLNLDDDESRLVNYITLELTRNARSYNFPYQWFKPSITLKHSTTYLYIQSENMFQNVFDQNWQKMYAIDQLINLINELNWLDYLWLKNLYRQKIMKSGLTWKWWGWLGFVDMSRKSKRVHPHVGNVFELKITKVTDDISHAIIRARMPIEPEDLITEDK